MSAADDQSDEFLLMGTYSIVDAKRLLAGLEAAQVNFRAGFKDGVSDIVPALSYFGGSFGQAAQATIRIAPEHKALAEQVHMELFGDCLPNYDASFFTDAGARSGDDG